MSIELPNNMSSVQSRFHSQHHQFSNHAIAQILYRHFNALVKFERAHLLFGNNGKSFYVKINVEKKFKHHIGASTEEW